MKMTTRVAYDNMKYYKSRNILIGIAIVLTTMLLLIIPTVGKGMVDLQFAAVRKVYPSWHALYRNVDEETVRQLAAHHDISVYGLRSDAGYMNLADADVSMMFMDAKGLALYKMELAEGNLPERKDEIVVSEGILKELGQRGDIGDTVSVPYQIYREGALDLTETKEFKICGFFEDSPSNLEKRIYTSLVSEAFIKEEVPKEEIVYRFLFQISDTDKSTTDNIETAIENIAVQFDISENETNINTEYLAANYVDPVTIPAIIIIMAIIMLAGVITIYSIYYVSMNQRVQEFGRLKAIGATKRQIKQIVLREGLCVAVLAIPAGLALGTLSSKAVISWFIYLFKEENELMKTLGEITRSGEVSLCYWWAYLLAITVTLCTVYISLLRPMHKAAKISEVEAMHAQGSGKKTQSRRKGYEYITVGRLTFRNLMDNKKKSAITVISMAATGVFLMVVATVLSCANPRESADSSIVGQYEISPIIKENDKEHPELSWLQVQKDNPLDENLKRQIEKLKGVEKVEAFTAIRVTGEMFMEGDVNAINGVPEEYAKELEKGIEKGKVTYEELKSGDKVILDSALKHWYPDLDVGSKLELTVHDGDREYEKEFEIAAVGNYDSGLTNYSWLIMAKEAADRLSENNSNLYFHIIADKDYDQNLFESLEEIVKSSGRIEMRTWKREYDQWKSAMATTRGATYAFLGILALISVMNLINTMLNSVHVRKKELGMMQAIGMSDSQLMKMLQLEGLFYTAGTLVISVGLGSIAGYPLFLYAKNQGIFSITTYHYPAAAAIIVTAALILLQGLLAVGIGKSVKKDSLIERVRFSE
ncbi:MAG: FtsX-like permease family protein [Dorea sp.]|jgi:putative ABC transport system permease protein|nr:FtsX-like permease family protein [Dorea sp.]